MKAAKQERLNQCAEFLRELEKKIPDCLLISYFPHEKPQEIREMLIETASFFAPRKETSPSVTVTSPQVEAGMVSLYTDGASRGNPGLAGAGFVLLNEQGELTAGSKFLGKCTNNAAEYQALILGLKEAEKFGWTRLNIFLDSQLIVRQVQGRYKVKNAGLKPLFSEVRRLLDRLDSFGISHVPREENKRADELANQGIDRKR